MLPIHRLLCRAALRQRLSPVIHSSTVRHSSSSSTNNINLDRDSDDAASERQTHFGYQTVTEEEKVKRGETTALRQRMEKVVKLNCH